MRQREWVEQDCESKGFHSDNNRSSKTPPPPERDQIGEEKVKKQNKEEQGKRASENSGSQVTSGLEVFFALVKQKKEREGASDITTRLKTLMDEDGWKRSGAKWYAFLP